MVVLIQFYPVNQLPYLRGMSQLPVASVAGSLVGTPKSWEQKIGSEIHWFVVESCFRQSHVGPHGFLKTVDPKIMFFFPKRDQFWMILGYPIFRRSHVCHTYRLFRTLVSINRASPEVIHYGIYHDKPFGNCGSPIYRMKHPCLHQGLRQVVPRQHCLDAGANQRKFKGNPETLLLPFVTCF